MKGTSIPTTMVYRVDNMYHADMVGEFPRVKTPLNRRSVGSFLDYGHQSDLEAEEKDIDDSIVEFESVTKPCFCC